MKRSSRRTPITRQYFSRVNQTLKLVIPGHREPIYITLRDKYMTDDIHVYYVKVIGHYNDYLFDLIPGSLQKERVHMEAAWKKKYHSNPPGGIWPYMPTIDDINDQLMRLYNKIDNTGITIPYIHTVIGSYIAQIAPDYIKVGCTIIKGKELTNLLAILKEVYFDKGKGKIKTKAVKRKAINNPL